MFDLYHILKCKLFCLWLNRPKSIQSDEWKLWFILKVHSSRKLTYNHPIVHDLHIHSVVNSKVSSIQILLTLANAKVYRPSSHCGGNFQKIPIFPLPFKLSRFFTDILILFGNTFELLFKSKLFSRNFSFCWKNRDFPICSQKNPIFIGNSRWTF